MRIFAVVLFTLIAVAAAQVMSDYFSAVLFGVAAFAALIGVGRFIRIFAGIVMILRSFGA